MIKTTSITIAQIRMARGLINISQSKVAKEIKLSPSSYGAIEAELSDPKVSTFNKIVEYYETHGVIFKADGSVLLK